MKKPFWRVGSSPWPDKNLAELARKDQEFRGKNKEEEKRRENCWDGDLNEDSETRVLYDVDSFLLGRPLIIVFF